MAKSAYTTRRLFLAGVAAVSSAPIAATAATSDKPASSPLLHSEPKTNWALVKIVDDHASPFVNCGEHALYDCEDRSPTHGDLFMTVTDSGRYFIVGAALIDGDWYAGAPNRKQTRSKLVGPMTTEFFKSRIVGRLAAATFKL